MKALLAYCLIFLGTCIWSAAAQDFEDMEASDTADAFAARIADLNPPEKGLPDDVLGLNDERQLLQKDISQLRVFIQSDNDVTKEVGSIDQAKAATSVAFAEFAKVTDCASLGDGQIDLVLQIQRPISKVSRDLFLFSDVDSIDNPWDNAPTVRSIDSANARDACKRWKTFLGNSGTQEKLLNYFDTLKSSLIERSKVNADARDKAKTLLDILQKRRVIVESRLTKKATQDTLTDKFWIALLVIGIFSVGTILAVKLFTPEIQLEWVASGQVIQFVTVMILLSVVMALGLAGILKENTLGTLLGGIAGYVLAQGVGRAAAREVSRGQNVALPGPYSPSSPSSPPASHLPSGQQG